MRVTLFTALLVGIDQLTKYLAVQYLQPLHSVEILPGLFNLTYVENSGAAWGILAGRQLLLISFSLLTLGFFVWRRHVLFGSLYCKNLIMVLIFGGVIGNLIDRVMHAYVIDFLDFYWRGSHFPAFNVADSAICCGVFGYILSQWLYERRCAAVSGCAADNNA